MQVQLAMVFEGFEVIAGLWTVEEAQRSPNWREIRTWSLQIYQYHLHLAKKVSVYSTDLVVAACYIRKVYAKTPELSRSAAETVKFMEIYKIIQIPRIVSQEEIKSSDILSRLKEKDELTLSRSFSTNGWLGVGFTHR